MSRPLPTRTSLLNSRDAYDARLLGYDAAVDPAEDGDGLIVTVETTAPDPFSCPSGRSLVSIVTANGCVEIDADIVVRIAAMLRAPVQRVAA